APSAEVRGPVVERAGGRQRRGQLAEAERDAHRQDRDQRPAEEHLDRPAVLEAVAVEGDRAGEDRDDREAEREVGEAAHVAQQLLRVSKLLQLLGVAIHVRSRLRYRAIVTNPRVPVQIPDRSVRVQAALRFAAGAAPGGTLSASLCFLCEQLALMTA